MNKYQKLVQAQFLNDEEAVIKRLKNVYNQSLKDLEKKTQALQDQIDDLGKLAKLAISPEEKEIILSKQRSKIYQKQYQDSLKKQVDSILDTMYHKEFKTVSKYLEECYENGFVGTMFDLQGQGIPLCFPLDQESMVTAVQLDSKISKGLYTRLGEDVTTLKKKITAQVSRGIATGMTFPQVAKQLAACSNIGYNNAIRIARTEGHRIQCQSGMDACCMAKDRGADVLKQWDATLDGATRESHTAVDGEIRELDKPFSNGLMFPGDPSGGAAEVINCRCALLQRAKWALDDEELETLKKRAEFFGLDKAETFEDFKAKYLKAAQTAPVKKEYLTKKKLEQKITEIDQKLKQLPAGGDEAQKLEALKADYQEKLDKKINAAETKKLKKDQILLQDQLDAFDTDEKFGGIWYGQDDITIKDWNAKQSSIQKKVDWYEDHIKNAAVYGHTQDDIDKFTDLLKKTKDFDKKGAEYYSIQQKLSKTKADLTKLQKSGKITQAENAFTQDRKDAALWAKSTKTADNSLRGVCGDVWQQADQNERYAIYDYTCGSGKFNRPLSGFEKPYAEYGTGWESKYFKGVGNVWIDYEGAGDEIRQVTSIISKSTYDFDMWLQHGCQGSTLESFLGLPENTFQRMSESELQQFVGRSNRRGSFMSCGVSKGKGFDHQPVIINVYAPKGTQMMYCEPFSHFGNGSGLNWDGISHQSSFGSEAEMLVQRGASFEITKIEKSGGKIYIDMDIHPEDGYDLFQQDPSEWKGSTKKGR
jgi:uncharacterized protein with gpF-like domain